MKLERKKLFYIKTFINTYFRMKTKQANKIRKKMKNSTIKTKAP
jgi:hypothetical protein